MSRMPTYQHTRRVLLDGVYQDVLVMKEDKANKDIYFIKESYLDRIDRDRIIKILRRRDANRYELWDLMSQVVLPNGQNALVLYHQLVRVLHANGKTSAPGRGFGASPAMSLTRELTGRDAPVAQEEAQAQAAAAAKSTKATKS